MVIDVSKIIGKNQAILTRDALQCKEVCVKNKKHSEIILDLIGLELIVSRWFDILIYELSKVEMLDKVKFINIKNEIWQHKLDNALKLAKDKDYRKFYNKIISELFEG